MDCHVASLRFAPRNDGYLSFLVTLLAFSMSPRLASELAGGTP